MIPEFVKNPNVDIYKTGSYVVLDFETSNKDKGDALNEENAIVMAYWLVVDEHGNRKGRYCFANDIAQSKLVSDIESVDFVVAQNAKFELQWLHRCGLDLHSVVVYDTMIAEYVISGNRKRSLSLDATAKRYGLGAKEGLVAKMIKQGICPSTIRADWLKTYCKQDVLLTDKVFKAQLDWIDNNYPRLLNVVYTRCLLTPVLADIERNGMTLDAERVENTRNEYLQKLAEVDEKLYEINPDINWNSPKQKAEYLYDELGFNELTDFRGEVIRTPSGGRKTDSDTIEALNCKTEIQRTVVSLIKERNKYASALSKNLNFFYGVCREYGGVFRGVFNQCVTSTHRLSSSGRKLSFACLDGKEAGAQFQNLPRDFKSLFRASGKDRVLGEVDGSQLEFRVAGHLGRDEQVYYDVTHEVDIHAFTAQTLTAAGEETSRQDAKASCFPMHTKYLTPSGWKTYRDLKVGDTVLSYNQHKNKLELDTVIDKPPVQKGDVIEIGHSAWKFKCTPDHRWYGEKRTDRGSMGRKYVPGVVKAENINTSWKITTAAPFLSEGFISPDDAARLAWIYSDGSIRVSKLTGTTSQGKDGRRRAINACVIQSYKKFHKEVAELFGNPTYQVPDTGCFVWRLSSSYVRGLFNRCDLDPEKPDWTSFLFNCNNIARKKWLEAVLQAEGTQREHGQWRVSQNSGDFCEAIKLCATLEGYDIRVGKTRSYTGKVNETITLRKKRHITGQKIEKIFKGQEDVACITTNNHTVVVKQNETVTISGQTFRPLYGGSSGTPAVQEYCKAFRQKYNQLSDVQFGWATEASDTKRLETEWGMVYYFPYAEVTKSGYITDSTKIYNIPIQAFATAEIIPIALVFFWHMTKDTDIVIANTVHDSIICDMPRDSVAQFAEIGTECMIDHVYQYLRDVYDVEMYVPLGIGIKVGNHWNEPDKNLAPAIIEGIQECGYEAINDDDKEIKADQHRKFALSA